MPDRTVTSNGHHIPDGTHRDDDGWRPILCGGGITDPGPDITIPDPDVCPDCLDALADDTHPLTPLADRMAVTYQGEPDTGWARRLHRRGMRDVLTLLEREGWGPCASRCRHHNGMCSDIVDANEAMGEALTQARNLLGELRLYVDWRYVTMQLTTAQKELWAQAVEAWRPDPDEPPTRTVDRWWCPTCGVSTSSGLGSGPHKGCMWAEDAPDVQD